MARFYYRRGGRRYRRRFWRRNWYKRGSKVSGSQKSGTRRFSLVIPIEERVSLPCLTGLPGSATFAIQPFYSNDLGIRLDSQLSRFHVGDLVSSPIYNIYKNLYDEVKINGMSFMISIDSMGTAGQSLTGANLYTCVDRHCDLSDLDHGYTLAEIKNGVEHQRFSFTSYDKATFGRYFTAKDLMEKCIFNDATVETAAVAASGTVPAYNRTDVKDWYDHSRGGFAPLVVGQFEKAVGNWEANSFVNFSISVRWYVTYRNPKYLIDVNNRSVEIEKAGKKESGGEREVSKEEMEELMEKLKKLGLVGEDDTVLVDDMDEDEKS